MPTPYSQLLEQLKAAQGDTAQLALVTFDFAVAGDARLKAAAEAAAIPHWFNAKTLAVLLPEHAAQAEALVEQLKALPMVEPFARGDGEPTWNVHEATRLALRERLWQADPERFKELSRRAARAYGSADPAAPDFVLTSEHLYHRLAGQTNFGDATLAKVADQWRAGFAGERLQTLALLLEELLATKPAPPLLPRGKELAYFTIAAARERLSDLAVSEGDLAGALRSFTESKTIRERLAASDPTNAGWQRDLSVSLEKLGDLAVAQGDLAGALGYFTESKTMRERLAASDPANALWQRDLWVLYWRLADLCEKSQQADEALVWWRKAHAALADMKQHGILRPADEQYLEHLRAKLAQ